MGFFLGLRMLPTGKCLSLASSSPAVEVRDPHHEVGLDMGIIFMHNICLYGMVPGARDAANGHVFFASIGEWLR